MDVVVPASIFNAATVQKAPVLAWINGEGYAGGWKPLYGNPAGLLAKSRDNGQQGVVYVAMKLQNWPLCKFQQRRWQSCSGILTFGTDNFEISNRAF